MEINRKYVVLEYLYMCFDAVANLPLLPEVPFLTWIDFNPSMDK